MALEQMERATVMLWKCREIAHVVRIGKRGVPDAGQKSGTAVMLGERDRDLSAVI